VGGGADSTTPTTRGCATPLARPTHRSPRPPAPTRVTGLERSSAAPVPIAPGWARCPPGCPSCAARPAGRLAVTAARGCPCGGAVAPGRPPVASRPCRRVSRRRRGRCAGEGLRRRATRAVWADAAGGSGGVFPFLRVVGPRRWGCRGVVSWRWWRVCWFLGGTRLWGSRCLGRRSGPVWGSRSGSRV
jgi:hypothetical protein